MRNSLYNAFQFDKSGYFIFMTEKRYSRTTSGRSWKKYPDSTEKKIVSNQFYSNYVSSVPFFNNFGDGAYCRCKKEYQCAGYLPTFINTVSPGRTEKIETTFYFINRDDLDRKAGFRENDIMNRATHFDMAYENGHNLIYFITGPDKDGHSDSCVWDRSFCGSWIG